MSVTHNEHPVKNKISFNFTSFLVAVHSITLSDYVVSKDCMATNNEFKGIRKIAVGLLPWNVPRRNEETYERSQDSR